MKVPIIREDYGIVIAVLTFVFIIICSYYIIVFVCKRVKRVKCIYDEEGKKKRRKQIPQDSDSDDSTTD